MSELYLHDGRINFGDRQAKGFLISLLVLFQSLAAVKENGAVLYLHPVGVPRLAS